MTADIIPSGRAETVVGWLGVGLLLGAVAPWIVAWSDDSVPGEPTVRVVAPWELVNPGPLGGAGVPLVVVALLAAVTLAVVMLVRRGDGRRRANLGLAGGVIGLVAVVVLLSAVMLELTRLLSSGLTGAAVSLRALPGPGLILPIIGAGLVITASNRIRRSGQVSADSVATAGATGVMSALAIGDTPTTTGSWYSGTTPTVPVTSQFPNPAGSTPAMSEPSSVTSINPWIPVGIVFAAVALVGVAVIYAVSQGGTGGRSTANAPKIATTPTTVRSVPVPPTPVPPTPVPPTPVPPTPVPPTPVPPTPVPPTPVPPNTPQVMTESEALAKLTATIDSQTATVDSLIGTWVPQVSSKRPGLDVPNDDRGAYTAADVLSDYQGYRDRYGSVGAGALLLRSGDYNFKLPDYYVTIVGVSFASPQEANGWCDAQDIRADDCYAKRIDRSGDWQNSTLSRK